MTARLIRFFSVLCFLSTSSALLAQQFSADFVEQRDGQDSQRGKIFVGQDMARIDGVGEEGMRGTVILNLSSHVIEFLMPSRKIYLESTQGKDPKLLTVFRPSDPNNACPEWLKVAEEGSKCQKIGADTLNGRATVKYQGTSPEGGNGYVWVDPSLKFVVKWHQDGGNGGELQNIQLASQDTGLFAVPADYQKMNLGNHPMRQHP